MLIRLLETPLVHESCGQRNQYDDHDMTAGVQSSRYIHPHMQVSVDGTLPLTPGEPRRSASCNVAGLSK